MSTEDATAAPSAAEGGTVLKAPPEPVTPFEARVVWETIIDPTAPKVVKHFAMHGRSIGGSTILDWKARGWREREDEFQDNLGDRLFAVGLDKKLDPDLREEEVNQLLRCSNDAHLLRSAIRSTCAATIKAQLEIAREIRTMVKEAPHNIGSAIQRNSAAIPNAVAGMDRLALLDQRAAVAANPTAPTKDEATQENPLEGMMSAERAAWRREADKKPSLQ